MKKASFFLCAATFLLAGKVAALETKINGSVTAQAGTLFPYAKNAGDFIAGETAAIASVTLYGAKSTLYVQGTALYDAVNKQPAQSDFFVGNDYGGFKLNEAWFDYAGDYFALRLGRQIHSWGKADMIPITDILCPINYTNIMFKEYKDAHIGIDALTATFRRDSFSINAYWIPFFTPEVNLFFNSKVPLSNWLQFFAPQVSQYASDIMSSTGLSIPASRPDLKLTESEFAMRISFYHSLFDFSFYGFYGHERSPVEISSSVKEISGIKLPVIKAYYPRMVMFGADAAIPVGNIVLRLETAYYPQRYMFVANQDMIKSITKKDMEFYERHHEIFALAGFDWQIQGLFLTAQYFTDITFGDLDLLQRERAAHCATLSLTHSFFNDALNVTAAGLIEFKDFSHVIMLRTNYHFTDHISFFLNAAFINYLAESEIKALEDYKYWGGFTVGGKFSF